MSSDQKKVVFSLLAAMAVGLSLAASQAVAYDKFGDVRGESNDNSHDEWIDLDEWPNPMERGTGTTAPATRPGTQLMPVEKAGLSEPAMRPGVTSPGGRASSVPEMPGATPGGLEIMDAGKQR